MIRSRLVAAAALVTLAAGAAQAQPRGATPMTPVSPQAPASPTAPPSPTPTTPAPGAGQATTGTPRDAAPGPGATVAPAPATPPPGASVSTTPAGATTPPSAFTPVPAGADLASTLKGSGQFTTLLKAVDATGLTPVLATPGLTVFAPTDAAFAALPAGRLDELMKQENLPQLQKLLTYHVVNAKIPDFKGRTASVTSASGQKLYLDATGEAVKVNDATALQAELNAGTSHIYVIDKVVMPDFTPPTPPPEAAAPAEAGPAKATTKATTTKTTRKKR